MPGKEDIFREATKFEQTDRSPARTPYTHAHSIQRESRGGKNFPEKQKQTNKITPAQK
jgi:hypothetical protein